MSPHLSNEAGAFDVQYRGTYLYAMDLTRRLPELRWSVWRAAVGFRNIARNTGQVDDGREAAALDYVVTHARRGDVDDVVATIDKFAYEKSFLVNVGDEKGVLLDAAVRERSASGVGAGHLLRLWRSTDRPGGLVGKSGLGGDVRR